MGEVVSRYVRGLELIIYEDLSLFLVFGIKRKRSGRTDHVPIIRLGGIEGLRRPAHIIIEDEFNGFSLAIASVRVPHDGSDTSLRIEQAGERGGPVTNKHRP